MPNPLASLRDAGLTNPALVQQALKAQQEKERRGVIGIARLRQLGFSDEEIFRMSSEDVQAYGDPNADPMRLAGGYGMLGPATQMAGIVSQYRLGRAGLARDLSNDRFNRQTQLSQMAARPFNTVAYLDSLARTGARLPLTNPTLQNIKPITVDLPEDKYQALADDVFEDETVPKFGRGGTMRTNEPIVGLGLRSRRPRFVVGEAGPEELSGGGGEMRVRPLGRVRKFAGGGAIRAPRGGALAKAIAEQKARAPQRLKVAADQAAKAKALSGIDPNTDMTKGGVVIDGVRYSGSSTPHGATAGAQAKMYERSGRQTRHAVDPIRYRRGRITGTYGGSQLTEEERAQRIADYEARTGRQAGQHYGTQEDFLEARRAAGGGQDAGYDIEGQRDEATSFGGSRGNMRQPVNRTDQGAPPPFEGRSRLGRRRVNAGQQPYNAQQATARMLADTLGGIADPRIADLQRRLRSNDVPGVLPPDLMALMDPTRRDVFADLWGSTGQMAGPEDIEYALRAMRPSSIW